nr:methyltransferase domain-containing protein [Nocardia neocaledoniensis]
MTGDTADMLDARAAFQSAGHFAPVATAVARAFGTAAAGNPRDTGDSSPTTVILEVGAGTGYYLGEVLTAEPQARGIALDVSKPAARRAARAHPRMASVLADAWRGLPIRDDALAGVLSVFAPRNPAEVARVLAPGGRFVVATPTARHLNELVGPLDMVRVDPDKERRLADSLAGTFTRADHSLVEFPMKLSRHDVTNVIAMGPSAFHGTPSNDPRIAALPDTTEVTASVDISVYLPAS